MVNLRDLLLVAPILLFSIIAHEYAHGCAALKQGDTTAQQLGRLTWNPIKHIDPFMSVLLPLTLYLTHTGVILAGAKPVPVNPRNYRDYRRGDIIVSLAGVTANIAIALGCLIVAALLGVLGRTVPAALDICATLQTAMFVGIYLNLALGAFNLLPIPPLDGSHVMKYLLPPAWAQRYQRIGFAGLIILVILFNSPLATFWIVTLRTAIAFLIQGLGPFALSNHAL